MYPGCGSKIPHFFSGEGTYTHSDRAVRPDQSPEICMSEYLSCHKKKSHYRLFFQNRCNRIFALHDSIADFLCDPPMYLYPHGHLIE